MDGLCVKNLLHGGILTLKLVARIWVVEKKIQQWCISQKRKNKKKNEKEKERKENTAMVPFKRKVFKEYLIVSSRRFLLVNHSHWGHSFQQFVIGPSDGWILHAFNMDAWPL